MIVQYQTVSKCIASFPKSKSAEMERIEVLFISCACVRNILKIVKLVIGKMKVVSFS